MTEDKYHTADSVIACYDWFVRIKSILSHDLTKRAFRLRYKHKFYYQLLKQLSPVVTSGFAVLDINEY